LAIIEVKNRPGWYDVLVYDKVSRPGQRPARVKQRVKGRKAAEKAERDLQAARDRGSLTARRQSVSAYADRWLASRRAEVSKQTHAGYARIVHEYIDRHTIGGMKVAEVDVTAVSTFYADLLERGSVGRPVSVETVRGVHRVLSMVLKRAVVDGLLHVNPCTVAKPPRHDSVVERHEDEPGIDPAAARELVADLEGTNVGTIAAVALGTGLRRSELLALKWENVDLEAGALHVVGKLEQVGGMVERTAPKTKRSRRSVPLGTNVAAVLKRQKATIAEARLPLKRNRLWSDESWVFPSLRVSFKRDGTIMKAGRCWTPNALAEEWRRAIDRVNERRLGSTSPMGGGGRLPSARGGNPRPPSLLRTAQLAAGVRDEVVSRRMGHISSLVTLRVYSHVVNAENRDGVDVADGLL
jgi:integrase